MLTFLTEIVPTVLIYLTGLVLTLLKCIKALVLTVLIVITSFHDPVWNPVCAHILTMTFH